MSNVTETHRLDELDALTERLEAAEEKLETAQKNAKTAMLSAAGLWAVMWLVANAIGELRDRPTFYGREWLESRVEDLERRFHLHLHPKEVVHDDH